VVVCLAYATAGRTAPEGVVRVFGSREFLFDGVQDVFAASLPVVVVRHRFLDRGDRTPGDGGRRRDAVESLDVNSTGGQVEPSDGVGLAYERERSVHTGVRW
jgi:hypothetical protein